MKNDGIKSVVVLFCICLAVAVLLAVTNQFTAPVIEQVNAEASKKACSEVMQANDFTLLTLPDNCPDAVTEIFQADNGGYVFNMKVTGYNTGLVIVCGIDAEGYITGTATVTTNETPTIGGKALDSLHATIAGKDSSLAGVNGISGATYTSKAYRTALESAFEAYNLVKGGN